MMQAPQPESRNNCGLSMSHCDGSTERSFFVQAQVSSVFVVQVNNATPIILNREKSITLGILGTLELWRSTKLSPGMGELCADAASMRTQGLGSWRSRNGPWSAAVLCWI